MAFNWRNFANSLANDLKEKYVKSHADFIIEQWLNDSSRKNLNIYDDMVENKKWTKYEIARWILDQKNK
jgi:hypothetical protein